MLSNYDMICQAWNLTTFSTKIKSVARESRLTLIAKQDYIRVSLTRTTSSLALTNLRRTSSLYVQPKAERSRRQSNSTHVIPTNTNSEETSSRRPTLVHAELVSQRLASIGAMQVVEDSGTGPYFSETTANYRAYKKYTAFLDSPVPSDLENHIILCGMPNLLHDFIAPLRQIRHSGGSVYNGTHHLDNTPIVIISNMSLTQKQYACISCFDNIYFVQGSPLSIAILNRANTTKGKSVVILRTCCAESLNTTSNANELIDQNMIDTDAITVHRFISDICEMNKDPNATKPTILIELSRPNSLRFLHDPQLNVKADHKDTIRLLTKCVISCADDPLDNICHPLYAAGKVFISTSLDALFGICNKYGSIVDIIHLLVLGEPRSHDAFHHGRAFDQIDIPTIMWGRPYAACFEELLLHHNILCVGLYRSRKDDTNFVFVNPEPQVILDKRDNLEDKFRFCIRSITLRFQGQSTKLSWYEGTADSTVERSVKVLLQLPEDSRLLLKDEDGDTVPIAACLPSATYTVLDYSSNEAVAESPPPLLPLLPAKRRRTCSISSIVACFVQAFTVAISHDDVVNFVPNYGDLALHNLYWRVVPEKHHPNDATSFYKIASSSIVLDRQRAIRYYLIPPKEYCQLPPSGKGPILRAYLSPQDPEARKKLSPLSYQIDTSVDTLMDQYLQFLKNFTPISKATFIKHQPKSTNEALTAL
ncbi:hypothetical protein THRCLA_07640 [Thraustotheca clavata]|uniref:RCK N-terminal domain-containing protein n=1 Tax=Thraustotheca clavata TaxID=74557 RepID=A0A1V9ZCH8_9STRA|nr:hypothetical protein THRCLA_07640 [Thraustotheca clavata]